jgi:hypothetical protein
MSEVDHALNYSELDVLDMMTWGPYMVDRMTVQQLHSAIMFRFGIPLEGPAPKQKTEAALARQHHVYEKVVLMQILRAWTMEHIGTKNFHAAPHCDVARLILMRLDAFDQAEKGECTIYNYMRAVTTRSEPQMFRELRAEAKKLSSAKNGDLDE